MRRGKSAFRRSLLHKKSVSQICRSNSNSGRNKLKKIVLSQKRLDWLAKSSVYTRIVALVTTENDRVIHESCDAFIGTRLRGVITESSVYWQQTFSNCGLQPALELSTQGGQSLKLSTEAAVFKTVRLFFRGLSMLIG